MKQMYEQVNDEQYTMEDAQLDMGCCSYDTGIEYDVISKIAERAVKAWGLRKSVKHACNVAYFVAEIPTV